MARGPFFSVIIPTLHEEKCLPRLLEDLGEQTYTDFEVRVIDAHSEDHTIEEAKKFKNKLKLTIEVVTKRGVASQRNAGAKRANGQYVVFLDADVQLLPQYLETIYAFIQSRKARPKFLTTLVRSDSDEAGDDLVAFGYNASMVVGKYFENGMVYGFNFIVEKEVFNKVGGFDEQIKIAEDQELATRLVKQGWELEIVPKLILRMSLRRFKKEGTLKLLRKYSESFLRTINNDPIKNWEKFEYEMGGQAHEITREDKDKFEEFIAKIEKLFRGAGKNGKAEHTN